MQKKEISYSVDLDMHKGENITVDENDGFGAVLSLERGHMVKKTGEYETTYIPFHAIEKGVATKDEKTVEVEDDFCKTETPPGQPRIDGADNTSIRQGTDFDLLEGVMAYDGNGNEIPFSVTPDEVDKCSVGVQKFTYSAEGVTKERDITVTQIPNPTISGLTDLTVNVGEEFDEMDGVSAVDGNGNTIPVTVEN